MTASSDQQALIAFNRFGLGARPGGPSRIGADVKAALRKEVETAGTALIRDTTLPNYKTACHVAQTSSTDAELLRQKEMGARVDKQLSVEIGFVERLVMFWANHFSMTVNKTAAVRGTIGQWERGTVRANVLGRFYNMLHGTMKHPAMIAYLDNDSSIGPNSYGGRFGGGFNENLAREMMELHTIGGDGGYTEEDVSAFAKILTGWSYVRKPEADNNTNGGSDANRGQFIYRADWHEPGPITLLGKSYPAVGQAQAEQAMADLAKHPATAEHIAFKLVRHFIADDPTPDMVQPIQTAFSQSGGDLKAVALALIDLPAAWSTPLTRLRSPYEILIAQYRALGTRFPNDKFSALSEPLRELHQMPWEAPSPAGYSDATPTWLNPDGVRLRLDIAQYSSRLYRPNYTGNVTQLAVSLLGSALTSQTRERLAGIGNSNNALTILFTCPEFQRR